MTSALKDSNSSKRFKELLMMYAQDEIYLICHNLVLKELRDKKDKEAKDKDEFPSSTV